MELFLYKTTNSKMGQIFKLSEYPQLEEFDKLRHKTIKNNYKSFEKYFEKTNENFNDYTIIGYGPIYGPDDPTDGYVLSNNKTEELISVPDTDIPLITKNEDCLFADTIGYLSTTQKIKPGIYTELNDVENIKSEFFENNQTKFNLEFIDDWVDGRTFLLIK